MAVDGGKVLGSAGAGAAMGTAIMPGWGTAIGAIGGGLYGLLSGGSDNNAAPQAPPAQFAAGNGSQLTNQLAALQYSEGLTQQQAQNAREAAFYNQGNQNFDIANAAQMRGAPTIMANQADQKRQLAALGATNAAGQQMSNTGDLLTQMGTNPMGPSYAEAQLRQGQDAAMAQQLSMARSGRSLGSGQAAMNQAAFNNAAINQQTNLGAANARIQEQQNYNQFQLGALQGAGNAYGGAGGLAGQAGGQATTIRAGNEGLQAQNAALGQQQQQINNQTTGMYNQLGSQQQQLGMQANSQGQNAYQFGAQQGQNAQIAQLNANLGQTSATTQTNIANQNNANAHDAANVNMAASGFAAAADALGNSGGGGGSAYQPSANNPSGSTSPYANISKSSNNPNPMSDERQKTNIKALGGTIPPRPPGLTSPTTDAKNAIKYSGMTPSQAAAVYAADLAAERGDESFTANGKTQLLYPHGKDTPMDDQELGKVAVTGEGSPGAGPDEYGRTIAALNAAYRPSQFAGADVLNRVPGAGAGPSASQAALIAALQGGGSKAPGGGGGMLPTKDVLPAEGFTRGNAPMASAATLNLDLGLQPTTGSGRTLGAGPLGGSVSLTPSAARAPVAAPVAPSAPAAWGDVFNAPQLDARTMAYLSGANQAPVAPSGPMHYPGAPGADTVSPNSLGSTRYQTNDLGYNPTNPADVNIEAGGPMRLSDEHSKTRIRELETQLAALSADAPRAQPPTASFAPQAPDMAALDAAYRSQGGQPLQPGVDFRNAHGYEYEYKDPRAPGAAPGKQVGTMAQELERTSAAPYVRDTPRGKQVDTSRLPLALAPAVGETQRRVDDLEAQLNALQGSGLGATPAYDPSLYLRPRAAY